MRLCLIVSSEPIPCPAIPDEETFLRELNDIGKRETVRLVARLRGAVTGSLLIVAHCYE